jgi:hypothetical protein
MTAAQDILVLYWYPQPMRPAIRHHLEALKYSPHGHRLRYVNVAEGVPPDLPRTKIDVLVLHTTLLCLRWSDRFHDFLRRLDWVRDCPALKLALPQDEYDHAEVLDEWLYHWDVPVIFTNFGPAYRPLLYPLMHARATFVHAFTGYIDPDTAAALRDRLPPAADRPVDVVFRAAHLPYWFGRQGQLKHRIADIVRAAAGRHGLRCDISTRPEDAITSAAWFDFLTGARTIVGIESGSSALDARGQIQAFIRCQLARDPDLTFEEVSRLLPPGWDDHRFFALGPRHFEAVYTKTVQLLVEGDYDGVLHPGRHYLPIRPDYANLDDVLEQVRDARLLQAIADRAYDEIYLSNRHTYAELSNRIDEIILSRAPKARRPRRPRVA